MQLACLTLDKALSDTTFFKTKQKQYFFAFKANKDLLLYDLFHLFVCVCVGGVGMGVGKVWYVSYKAGGKAFQIHQPVVTCSGTVIPIIVTFT